MNASLSQVNPNIYDPTDFTPNDWSNIITISAAAISSVLLVLFKSRCTEINFCFGFWKCLRDPLAPDDEEEKKKEEEEKKKKEEKEQLTKPVAAANMERELNPPLLPRTDSVVQEVILEPEPEPAITGISAPTGLKDAEKLLPKV